MNDGAGPDLQEDERVADGQKVGTEEDMKLMRMRI